MADSTSQTDFDKLLALFDADRETAGAKYEVLRARLIKFFEWRGCDDGETLTDAVFDRVTGKIADGEQIENVGAYAAGVAGFVAKEYFRRAERRRESLDENPQLRAETGRDPADDAADERRFECLEDCLSALGAETRRLLIAYHEADERTLIPARKRLAAALGVSLNTLRIRVCRLKAKLESCVRDCCSKSDA